MKQYDPRTFRCLSRRLCHLQRPELPGLRRDDAWLRHATGRNSGAAQTAAAAAADGAVATGFHGLFNGNFMGFYGMFVVFYMGIRGACFSWGLRGI